MIHPETLVRILRWFKCRHKYVIFRTVEIYDYSFGTPDYPSVAHRYGLRPIGTQVHEWIMWHAAKYGYRMANRMSLGRWVDVFNGDLGIALTDTYTTRDFWRSFGLMSDVKGKHTGDKDAIETAKRVLKVD